MAGIRQALVATSYVREGQLFIPRRSAFDAAVKLWPNCGAVLRLEQSLAPRSTALNSYYWAVVIHIISEETGMTPEEAHEEMKQLHLPKRLTALRGNGRLNFPRVFDGTTTDLSNAEEWEYIENIQRWAAMEPLCCVIPDPTLV